MSNVPAQRKPAVFAGQTVKTRTVRTTPEGRAMTHSDTMPEIVLSSRDDIPGLPADAWHTAEIWCPIPGYRYYQASSRGNIRSIDREIGGRALKGQLLTPRKSHQGPSAGTRRAYWQVNLTADDGTKQTRPVHSLQMLAFAGPRPAGKPETRHLNDDPDDNRWAPGAGRDEVIAAGGNLLYGSRADQEADQAVNCPPAPKPPPVLCAAHSQPVTKGSKSRCHECVVQIGRDGAVRLAAGLTAEDAARDLGYPSPEGLVKLAARYGGWTGGPGGAQEAVTAPAVVAARRCGRFRGWLRVITRRNRHRA